MSIKQAFLRIPKTWVWIMGLVLSVGLGFMTFDRWWPLIGERIRTTLASQGQDPSQEGHNSNGEVESHAGHGHDDHAHDDANSLELSTQAMGNIGLDQDSLKPIQLETFRRVMTVPGIVVERPGRTRIQVSTQMAGVITQVHAVEGEAVTPGALLFELRITAEELVESQTELLKTVGDLDVENREIARLTKVTASGAVPQKALLERQYAKEKLENLLLAQREALRLHGLSENQIDEIAKRRRLFRDLRIVAPFPEGASSEIQLTRSNIVPASELREVPQAAEQPEIHPLIITNMPVHVGETVNAGTTLAELADYSELYIEGRTFEREVKTLSRVANNGWKIDALFEGAEGDREIVANLDLVYSATAIDVESRTLPFFVRLPNNLLRSVPSPNNHAFIEWQHRPGRRVQLLVPIEEMPDQIVLPVEAIAREGAESYVFQQNGTHFDRIPVQIKYRDASHAVIANDGSLFPGDVVARLGAHQMLMALKNKSGGGVDPHAGHNH